jgi:RNA polymerase sigma-70 factor (ECF subfamily)
MNADLDLATLVDRYYGPLYRFAHSLTGSESDACDLVQETFYIWVRKGSQLQQHSRVKSWLFTTLHREFLQAHRRRVRFPHVPVEDAEADLPGIEPDTLARIDGSRIVELLQQLDETFRGPLSLFYLEDHPYEEIAEILELPLGTVKSRLSRGIGHLRLLLAQDLGAGERNPGE